MNSEIPDFNNFYSYITEVSIESIVDIFRNWGWSVKSSTWGEWRLDNEWSDFILTKTASEKLLLNGAVIFDKLTIDKLKKTFAFTKGEYLCEFYKSDGTLLLEFKNI